MEEKTNLLQEEKSKMVSANQGLEEGDELDAYMTGLSSQLGKDVYIRNLFIVYHALCHDIDVMYHPSGSFPVYVLNMSFFLSKDILVIQNM